MFGLRNRQVPRFGGISADDDKDIEISRPSRSHGGFWAEARLLFRDLVFALMFATLLVVFVAQPVKVEGTSMLSKLHDGDRIFVNKLIYYGLPKMVRGDIVVFWYPNDPSKNYIKRIVALPGETVEVRHGRLFINGAELVEPYLDKDLNQSSVNYPMTIVKEHYYFVMGDNRDNSSDSRVWGLVPEKYIYGKALFRYWPLSGMSVISHDGSYPVQSATPIQTVEPTENGEEEPDRS